MNGYLNWSTPMYRVAFGYRDRGLRNTVKYMFLRFHLVRIGVSACKALARGAHHPSNPMGTGILAKHDPA